jgi:hypothetical protein
MTQALHLRHTSHNATITDIQLPCIVCKSPFREDRSYRCGYAGDLINYSLTWTHLYSGDLEDLQPVRVDLSGVARWQDLFTLAKISIGLCSDRGSDDTIVEYLRPRLR